MALVRLATAAAVMAATLGVTAAAADPAIEAAIRARKAQFQLYAFHAGVVGGMVQGNRPYDAAAAKAAADNLVALSGLSRMFQWPEGSANDTVEGTRALPAIWANFDDFTAKHEALHAATVALAAVAGDGLDALRGAMGAVGGACSACHQAYRAP